MSFNLAYILRESAAATPDKAVTLLGGVPMSYAELDAASDRVALGLRGLGVGAGDTVGLQLPNIPQFLVAYFGILKAGAVVVTMNVLLKAPEVAYYLGDSLARAFVTWDAVLGDAARGAAEAGVTEVFAVGDPGAAPGVRAFEALLAEHGGRQMAGREPTDTAVIIYTSGTTGQPKGAELTHYQLYMNCDIPGRLFGMRADDIALTVLPLFHVFGLSSILNVAVRFGATLSLVPRFTPKDVLEAIQRDRATVFEGVPTMFIGLLTAPDLDDYDLGSLRIAISGGAAIPADVMDSFEKTFGLTILEGYGLSETASTATFNVSAEERKAYSVGKPIWGTEVRIWNEQGEELPVGKDHVGELVIRGYNVMKGYYNRPEATAEAFAGGWFHTGDLGYVDDEGFFFIVDRKKELIIRGGYNVYPREIEEVLYTHTSIVEAAVVGVTDERLGEEVKAFVVVAAGAELTEADVIAYARERVAAYKYPRTVEFRDELPKGPTGKILKKAL